MRKRLKAADRLNQISETACNLARRSHYLLVTRKMIADELGITGEAVGYHVGTVDGLREIMVLTAIENEDAELLDQMKLEPRVVELC